MKKRNAVINFVILIILILLGIIVFWKPLTNVFSDVNKVKDFVNGFGVYAPIIFILLVALQVLVAPIPGQIAGLAGGFIFGVFWGIVYSMIGLILGSFIAFSLSRKLGRPFVEKMIKKENFEKYDKLINEKGKFTLFLIYILPALPDDAISFIAGLTKIKIRTLLIISAIGRLPGFVVLNIIGAGISSNAYLSIILFIIMMLASLIIYLKKEKIEDLMNELIKKFTS